MRITTTTRNAAAVALAAILVASTPLLAQRGSGQDASAGGTYDPATEVTLSGTVDEVVTTPGPGKGPGGLHLILRTQAGVSEVHVGPVTFMSAQGFELARGDLITVTGSQVEIGGEAAVIAREIRRGDGVLTLRDAQGFPVWAVRGGRR